MVRNLLQLLVHKAEDYWVNEVISHRGKVIIQRNVHLDITILKVRSKEDKMVITMVES